MQNLAAMDIFHSKAQLYEPIHYLSFRESFTLGLLFPHMVRQFSMLTEFHNDNEYTIFYEGMLI